MNYLLDTHVLLWWVENSPKLDSRFRSIIANPNNNIFVSIATYWEIAIKLTIKKIRLKVPLTKLIEQSDTQLLPIDIKHLTSLLKLPFLHHDPFDRILISQAKSERFTLLSQDQKIKAYFPKQS
ncbi:MAG: type II toxin-antitoxin system VapC family toxin [Microgenomates group bacterium]